MAGKAPWRKILKRETHKAARNYGNWARGAKTVSLHLECGHVDRRGISKAPKGDKVRCTKCWASDILTGKE